jgi:hypothetical protein
MCHPVHGIHRHPVESPAVAKSGIRNSLGCNRLGDPRTGQVAAQMN